ncbi:hypothetical protein Hypma_002723 [Hypsizygus marmoreus]|uniref:Uncharacterized protein n=1 Tax=Hypsizygus marmoreus TaxID=39966 RepID=A0A369J533_HYPMA|nr:hypothetical protein Hypma_002723 [Hypsizygus marmoreus]
MIDDCPVLPLEDAAQDLSSFPHALDDNGGVYSRTTGFPLESDAEFNTFLLLATEYGAETMRAKALFTVETRLPSTLGGWDQMREALTGNQWRPDRILAINLVHKVESFSILPTAIASLTNDTSASEIWRLPTP